MAETEYERELTCPHCGYVDRDSWELPDDECGEHDCPHCGVPYLWTRHVSISWSTRALGSGNPQQAAVQHEDTSHGAADVGVHCSGGANEAI